MKKKKVRDVVLTHGHEDHVGGLPYLLRVVRVPQVWATKLTLELVASKLFFFQAEGGIRVFHVTGVQTCALPISSSRSRPSGPRKPLPTSRSGRRPCPT